MHTLDRNLYEYLPTIYIIIGVILGLSFDNWGKYFAAIFVLAGVIVFNMRIVNRSNHESNYLD